METLMLLALFFDLWIPEPYLLWVPVKENPPIVVITKNQAWCRLNPQAWACRRR